MFCECGTYLPNRKICNICGNEANIETIITEKYYDIAQIQIANDKGAKIEQICPNCGKEEMYYKAIQLRSADEGQTIFYECDCGYKFTTHS